jgi:hypothetical protein
MWTAFRHLLVSSLGGPSKLAYEDEPREGPQLSSLHAGGILMIMADMKKPGYDSLKRDIMDLLVKSEPADPNEPVKSDLINAIELILEQYKPPK